MNEMTLTDLSFVENEKNKKPSKSNLLCYPLMNINNIYNSCFYIFKKKKKNI